MCKMSMIRVGATLLIAMTLGSCVPQDSRRPLTPPQPAAGQATSAPDANVRARARADEHAAPSWAAVEGRAARVRDNLILVLASMPAAYAVAARVRHRRAA